MIGNRDGSEWKVVVSGDSTDGRFAVLEFRVRRGAEPPRHVHSREAEVIYVLDGRVSIELDAERVEAPAGSWRLLPCGQEHSFAVETVEARLLVLHYPAGIEGCLLELEQAAQAQPDQHLIERLVTTAARFGVAITGPSRPK